MTFKKCMSVGLALAAALTAGRASAVVTNVWINDNAQGADWDDPANWQGGLVCSNGNYADLSALAAGQWITLTQDVTISGITVAGNAGEARALTTDVNSQLNFSTPATDPWASVLNITGGTWKMLVKNGGAATQPFVKRGAGTLELYNPFQGLIRIDAGMISLATSNSLPDLSLRISTANPCLSLACDSWIGSLYSNVTDPAPIQLNGHRLAVRGQGVDATVLRGSLLTDTGTVAAAGGTVSTLSGTPGAGTTLAALDGRLWVGATLPDPVAFYRFEDSSAVGKDSGANGNTLAANGSPAVVTDASRGHVLYVNGSSYLQGQTITGLPSGNQAYTVAFWMKPATAVGETAKVFGWGTAKSDYAFSGMRLDKGNQQILFTHWSDNQSIAFSYDSQWHHLAFTHETDGSNVAYVDGNAVRTWTQALSVTANGFQIGASTGWGAPNFTGFLDDFYVAANALTADQIVSLEALSGTAYGETTLNSRQPLEAQMNGTIELGEADQTVGTLGGPAIRGGVNLGGGRLTVGGIGAETSTVFHAVLSGTGDFIKDGADYHLTLSGASSYTGATRVAAGTLTLARGTSSRGPADGLVAYYSFDDASAIGRDAGTNNITLTASSSAGVTSVAGGVMGRAARFASNGFLVSSNLTSFANIFPSGNSPYTVSLWVKPDAACSTDGSFFSWGTAGNGSLATARFNTTRKTILHTNYGIALYATNGVSLADGDWHQLVVTYDQSKVVIYCDGVAIGEKAVSNLKVATSSPFRLGTLLDWGGIYYYTGDMDEVGVYNRAWSAAEAAAEYTSKAAFTDFTTSLPDPVARYSFDDAENPGKDSGANGYDLSASGTVAVAASEGISGGALDLRGGYGYLKAETFPALVPTNKAPFTVSLWACPDSDISESGAAISWGTSGHVFIFDVLTESSSSLKYRYYLTNNLYCTPVTLAGSAALRWHHFALVYDGSTQSFYEDGVLMARQSGITATTAADNFFIGRKFSSDTVWFKGLIDEVSIYDSALEAWQVRKLTRAALAISSAPILPETTPLTIDAGATVQVANAEQTVAGLSGSGTLALRGGLFRVAGDSTFGGTVSGSSGTFAVSNGTVTVGTSAFANFGGQVLVGSNGRVTGAGTLTATNAALADGIVITTGASASALPVADVSGALTVPANGTIQFTCLASAIPAGTYVIAQGSSASAPTGLAGWQVIPASAGYSAKFTVSGGKFCVTISKSGTVYRLE